jgi:hypothetical protein
VSSPIPTQQRLLRNLPTPASSSSLHRLGVMSPGLASHSRRCGLMPCRSGGEKVLFLHRSLAAGSHRCGRQPSRAPTELVCACRESTTCLSLPNNGTSPAPGPRGNRQPEPTAATVCSETGPWSGWDGRAAVQPHAGRGAGLPRSSEVATPFCCCHGSVSPSMYEVLCPTERRSTQVAGSSDRGRTPPLPWHPVGVAWTLPPVQMWKCFDRGVAERESLARFQRRHRKRRAPIRQAPGVRPSFRREAAVAARVARAVGNQWRLVPCCSTTPVLPALCWAELKGDGS